MRPPTANVARPVESDGNNVGNNVETILFSLVFLGFGWASLPNGPFAASPFARPDVAWLVLRESEEQKRCQMLDSQVLDLSLGLVLGLGSWGKTSAPGSRDVMCEAWPGARESKVRKPGKRGTKRRKQHLFSLLHIPPSACQMQYVQYVNATTELALTVALCSPGGGCTTEMRC